MKKRWIYVLIAAVLVIGAAVAAVLLINPFQKQEFVATVDGQKITRPEYNFFLYTVKSQMETVAQVTTESRKSFWASTIDGKNAQEMAKSKALENAKEFKIQLIKAKEKGITLGKDVAKSIDDEIDSNAKSLGQQELEKQLQEQFGMSISEYRSIYKDYVLAYYTFRQTTAKGITVSDDEVKKAYDENKDGLKDSSDKVTVRHILYLAKKTDKEEVRKAAEKKAQDMLARVKAGEDMKALALKYSEDTGVKSNEGQYIIGNDGRVYTISKNQLVAGSNTLVSEFPDWAFAKDRKVGDVGVVQTDYGYHVIKLEKRTSYDEVKDTAKYALQLTKYQEELDKWKSDTKYNVVTNKKVYDAIKII